MAGLNNCAHNKHSVSFERRRPSYSWHLATEQIGSWFNTRIIALAVNLTKTKYKIHQTTTANSLWRQKTRIFLRSYLPGISHICDFHYSLVRALKTKISCQKIMKKHKRKVLMELFWLKSTSETLRKTLRPKFRGKLMSVNVLAEQGLQSLLSVYCAHNCSNRPLFW